MITIHKFRPEGNDYRLTFSFDIFDYKGFTDDQLFATRAGATGYLLKSKRDILLINFEKFVFNSQARIKPDDSTRMSAYIRCQDANKYFNEHSELSMTSLCDMIIKMQPYLIKLLPDTKSNIHEQQFKNFNDLIGCCKEAVKHSQNGGAAEQIQDV